MHNIAYTHTKTNKHDTNITHYTSHHTPQGSDIRRGRLLSSTTSAPLQAVTLRLEVTAPLSQVKDAVNTLESLTEEGEVATALAQQGVEDVTKICALHVSYPLAYIPHVHPPPPHSRHSS